LIQRVGIVVPTLGKRPDYLIQCLESISKATAKGQSPFVTIVAPKSFDPSKYIDSGLVNKVVDDPGKGLSGAINLGISSMPEDIKYVNWLGDDDLLAGESLDLTHAFLDENPKTVLVFGACDYVDPKGEILWTNKSGQFAVPLLRFGPDLIPQPGALFRRESFNLVGGLNPSYNWAFDFDMLIKLGKIGKLSYLPRTLASFRWHPESLSVEFRKMSVSEASKVRVSHLPRILRLISLAWEYPVSQLTLIAGNRVTARARKTSKDK
jgi:hypothetical protein